MQLRYSAGGLHGAHWLGVGFPVAPGRMVGATAAIGSNEDGVALYALGAQFPGAVTALEFSWQTLENTAYEQSDGVSILTFRKRWDENQFQRPSDQLVLRPNDEQADLIFAVGPDAPPSGTSVDASSDSSSHSMTYHKGRDYATLWLGLEGFTPPPSAPPDPPPFPPSPPPPFPPPVPPLPLPPSSPPPAQCDGDGQRSNLTFFFYNERLTDDVGAACVVSPMPGLTMHYRVDHHNGVRLCAVLQPQP